MIWKDIENYPNYEINELGIIRNKKTQRILKGVKGGKGYITVKLGTPQKSFKVHKIVANTFMNGVPHGKEPNHIDGNKTNNAVSNLEFLTHQQNVQHAYDTGLKKTRKVMIVETGEVFQNVTVCAKAINGSVSAIYAVLNGQGRAHKHRGHSFRYVD